jgi:hypothetical protein
VETTPGVICLTSKMKLLWRHVHYYLNIQKALHNKSRESRNNPWSLPKTTTYEQQLRQDPCHVRKPTKGSICYPHCYFKSDPLHEMAQTGTYIRQRAKDHGLTTVLASKRSRFRARFPYIFGHSAIKPAQI